MVTLTGIQLIIISIGHIILLLLFPNYVFIICHGRSWYIITRKPILQRTYISDLLFWLLMRWNLRFLLFTSLLRLWCQTEMQVMGEDLLVLGWHLCCFTLQNLIFRRLMLTLQSGLMIVCKVQPLGRKMVSKRKFCKEISQKCLNSSKFQSL